MKKVLISLILSFNSVNSFAGNFFSNDNHLIFIGGGGEPAGAQGTQFDRSIEGLGDFYLENKNYKLKTSFNGGHPVTEALLKEKFRGEGKNERFTAESYQSIVDDLLRKMSKNPPEIGEDAKVILFINSHGGEKKGNTHEISTVGSGITNMNSINSSSAVSLDKLAAIAEMAEKKKIKLAIIDGSCHAGNTLALANSKTCVIAASGPSHYAYSNFADTFASLMRRGVSLEDVFLDTRDRLDGIGFPMISGSVGENVQNALYPYLTPYLYYHDQYRGMELDKIDNYIKGNLTDELVCRRENDYRSLKAIIDLIEKMNQIERKTFFSSKITIEKTVDLAELKNQIDLYKKTQDNYIQRLRELDTLNLDQKMTVSFGSLKNTYSYREILAMDVDSMIQEKDADLKRSDLSKSRKEMITNFRKLYVELKKAKEKLLAENTGLMKQKEIYEELKRDQNVGYDIAMSIGKEAHKAYNAYYKNLKKSSEKGEKLANNPCGDFVL